MGYRDSTDGWRRGATVLSLCLVLAVASASGQGAAPEAGKITVVSEGQFVFDKPISKLQFSPSLKFVFANDVRTAKVRVEIDFQAGPGRDGVAFSLPATSAKAVDVTSYQSEIALEIPDTAAPGTYKGQLKFIADPATVVISPPAIPFSFTIVDANITLRWDKGGDTLALGSVTTGGAGDFVGPKLSVIMDEGVETGTKVNFEAEDPHIWLRPSTGEPLKGIGALSAGTYDLVLNPDIPADSYRGEIKFNVLSVGTKINDATPPAVWEYRLDVTSPLAALLKLVGVVVVLALLGGGAWVLKSQMKGRKSSSGRPIPVEGMLEFIVPMERRPEKLERVGKTRIVFGDKGDLLKDVRNIHFEIAAFERDGRKLVELTRFKDSCAVFVNGEDAFNVELYDGDLLKFGEYPTFEVKFRNADLERPMAQVYGEEPTTPSATPVPGTTGAAYSAPAAISLADADGDDGQLESLSGESKPMTMPASSDIQADLDDFTELEPPARKKGAADDLSLDLDLDAPAPKKPAKPKGGDSIDLPEGFDLLGDDK